MNLGNRHSQHSFAKVPSANIARSTFNRSFAIKDTFYFDQLTPIFVDEILPGDTVNLNVKSFARLATQVVPLLDNMYLDYFFFFVPNRLVWDNWEKFNGAQDNPGDSTDFLIPQIEAPAGTGFEVGSVFDHMGIPTGVLNLSINALPNRALNLIWNDWFRDQNLQNSITVHKGDGPDPAADYPMLKSAKKHDYFTSCLPWPQKGASVSLPIGTSAPVYGETVSSAGGNLWQAWDTTLAAPINGQIRVDPSVGALQSASPGGMEGNALNTHVSIATSEQYALFPDAVPAYADLSEATAATINQFRQAIMLQSFLERDARGGTRYVEILRAHFNVISPDFRLQRPEFLSGGTTQITQHPVTQTSSSTETSPQANLAAFSTAAEFGNKIGFSKSFVEHGYVIGLIRARADITYQQGLNRMWSRLTRQDFFWPGFQQLGEQVVFNKEIYAQGTEVDDQAFGYQERHADYRYYPSSIRGHFRSTYPETLDVWHLAEEFGTLPGLNSTFIQSNTPIERSLVVAEGYPHLLYDGWFEYKHARPMITYGVPATLGRF